MDVDAAPPPKDLAFGAFSDRGPWVVDLARPAVARRHRSDCARPRARRFRSSPASGACRRSRRFVQAGSLVGGALLGWRLREYRKEGGPESRAGLSRRLRKAFEKLGPAYIKLGQIVSSGQGIFPDELVEEFKLCRDQVPPESFETVRRVVEEDLGPSARGGVRQLRPSVPRGRVDRAGARRHAAHRRGGGRQGAAAAGRDAWSASTSRRWRGSRRS